MTRGMIGDYTAAGIIGQFSCDHCGATARGIIGPIVQYPIGWTSTPWQGGRKIGEWTPANDRCPSCKDK